MVIIVETYLNYKALMFAPYDWRYSNLGQKSKLLNGGGSKA